MSSERDILSVEELNLTARHSIKNIIEKEEFTSYSVDVRDPTSSIGNLFGFLQTVIITGKTKDNNKKELMLFLKNFIPEQKQYSALDVPEAYQREAFMYKELFKLFETIEDKYEIPQEEKLNTVKGYSETNDEVIILEDVSFKDYKTYDGSEVMPLKYAELSIEQLAKLHAVAFIIQKENPTYFEEKIKTLNASYIFGLNLEIYFKNCCDIAKEALDEDAKSKLEQFFPKLIKVYSKYKYATLGEAICIVHSDYRINNIMVKEFDGQASKVIPIDYQLTHFGHPITDLLHFIFLGSDQDFRKNHMNHLKELYYSSFEKFLKRFDIVAENVYSKKKFEQDFSENMDYGLMCFLFYLPYTFGKRGEAPILVKGLEDIPIDLDDSYKDRFRGIVDDLIQWGYL
ncbi:uncharacterized protein LOC135077231 [Ostrinia nubilalis]|uniref:uncharacterized protein LOC135077231 n=1 Tax=Ostrinia nubilalis TaxID=29057 RepID=UPI003082492A